MSLFGIGKKSASKRQYSSINVDEPENIICYDSPFVFTDPDMTKGAIQNKYSSVFTYNKPISGIRSSSNVSLQKKSASQEFSSIYSYDSLFDFPDPDKKNTQIVNQYSSVFTYKKQVAGFRTGPEDYVQSEVDSWAYLFFSSAVLLFSWCVLILTFPATIWYYLKILSPHERLLVFRLGRIQPLRGPGSVITLPFVDNWQRLDTRVRAFNIPPQQFITDDNGVVELGANVHLQLVDMVRSALHVRDVDRATRTLGQTLLVNHLCKKTCSQLEKERNFLSLELQESFNQTSLEWGVQIVRIELSHVNILKPPNESSAVGPILSALKSMFSPSSSHSPLPDSLDVVQPSTSSSSGLYEQLRQHMQEIMTSSSLSGMEFLVRLEISGQNQSVFGLEVKGGTGRVLQEHEIKSIPDVALSLSEDDLHAILNHTLTPLQAYICGKLQVKGNVQLLMSLEGLLKTSKDRGSKRSVITV